MVSACMLFEKWLLNRNTIFIFEIEGMCISEDWKIRNRLSVDREEYKI